MHSLQLMVDCEGPLALNNIAFELCRKFIQPDGARFFQQVSRYDLYLAAVAQKPDYHPGEALKWILPFLKAQGLTNQQLRDYARKSLKLVPGVEGAYKFLQTQDFPIFAISTGYRQFAEVVGKKVGFSPKNILSTELDLDRFNLNALEKEELRKLQQEITAAPEIKPPPGATSLEDLPESVRQAIAVCDRIFGERLPQMGIGALSREIIPLGGSNKTRAVEESLARTKLPLKDVIYVGGNITDVEVFETVRAGGGLSISFNGSRSAVLAAEISVSADNAWPIALLASIFKTWGKEGVMELADKGSEGASRYLVLPDAVIDTLMRGLRGRNFNLRSSLSQDQETTILESLAMRAKLLGPEIASLA